MQGKLENEGKYELFKTTHGHQILNLNDKKWFAVVKGQYGDILVKSNSDHKKDKTVKKGKFYLANFDDDPEFNDLPHLFLQEGNKYREWILPNNAPSEKDYQKKLVKTDNLVDKKVVEYHVKGSGKKGSEKQYKGTDKYDKNKKEQLKTGQKKSKTKMRGSKKKGDLSERSKKELYDLAKENGVAGRSRMDKDDLIKAINKK